MFAFGAGEDLIRQPFGRPLGNSHSRLVAPCNFLRSVCLLPPLAAADFSPFPIGEGFLLWQYANRSGFTIAAPLPYWLYSVSGCIMPQAAIIKISGARLKIYRLRDSQIISKIINPKKAIMGTEREKQRFLICLKHTMPDMVR